MDHDHGASNGAPWLDMPVLLHSSRADTCKLTPEQCDYRSGHWRYWYEADHVFALNTVYLFVAAIGVCFVGFWVMRLAPASFANKPWWRKLVSGARFLSYRRYDINAIRWRTPSLGVSVLLIVGALFFLGMTLGPQPYYWPNTRTLSYGNSPPIATRTGWMALACMPFMIILPTKANMIASFTGVSHERLIVFHNWVGWAMFALALVHTFPFIIFHQWKGDMGTVWNTSVVYWTGVVAILTQAYLQFFSLSFIRDRYYEIFKLTHYIAAIVFVVFFFLHCDFRLSSWDYFIATGVLYTLSFLYSQIRTYFEFGFSHRATFTMVSDTVLKVTVPIDTTWQPGQHFFLRFVHLGLHALTAHPFTIASVPITKNSTGKPKLAFYVQPRGGLTGRLGAAALHQPGLSVPVLLDGPYGGVKGKPLSVYDHSLVVACGSGASLSLPFVMEAILRSAHQVKTENAKQQSTTQVIIATRDSKLVQWYGEALVEYMDENGVEKIPGNITISIYETGNGHFPSASEDLEQSSEKLNKGDTEVQITANKERLALSITSGRPDIPSIARDVTLQCDKSVGIAVCGPAEVLKLVQDEAAAAQLRILGSQPGAREVYLHSEVFSW